jgi:replication factor C subunit 3/5
LTEVGRLESTNLNNYIFTPDVINKIASTSNRNLRIALIQLQASRYTKSADGMLAPYKKEIKVISEMINKEQSPTQLRYIRDKFYDLLVNCIDGQTIIR